jgi:hypothetical protein
VDVRSTSELHRLMFDDACKPILNVSIVIKIGLMMHVNLS